MIAIARRTTKRRCRGEVVGAEPSLRIAGERTRATLLRRGQTVLRARPSGCARSVYRIVQLMQYRELRDDFEYQSRRHSASARCACRSPARTRRTSTATRRGACCAAPWTSASTTSTPPTRTTAARAKPWLGWALGDGYRERVKIATKLPTWKVERRDDFDRYLDEQLERLGTGIDFYLLHGLDAETLARPGARPRRAGVCRAGARATAASVTSGSRSTTTTRRSSRSSTAPISGSSARSSTTTWTRSTRRVRVASSSRPRRASACRDGAAARRPARAAHAGGGRALGRRPARPRELRPRRPSACRSRPSSGPCAGSGSTPRCRCCSAA